MKKFVYILFSLVYLTLSIGIIFSYHYCGNNVHSINLNPTGNLKEPANCCNENKSNECCQNEVKIIKLSEKYSRTFNIYSTTVQITKVIIPLNIKRENSQTISLVNLEVQYPQGKLISIHNRVLLI